MKAHQLLNLIFLVLTPAIKGYSNLPPDKHFLQPVSIKYKLPSSLNQAQLKKVAVDYNNNIYVLSDKGLYRVHENELIKDLRYTPLAGRVPVDICVQESSGHLFYLYDDKVLTNGYAGVPYNLIPKNKYSTFAVNQNGNILLAGANVMAILEDGKLKEIPKPPGKLSSITINNQYFYALTSEGFYRYGTDRFIQIHAGKDIKAYCFRGNEIIIGKSNGYYGINQNGQTIFPLQDKLPVNNINVLSEVKGNIWAGTTMGAFMREPSGTFRYYASKRWLNEDNVLSINSDSNGDVYVLTATGLNKIQFISQTLYDKAVYFQNKIRQRHIRYGFISNVTLSKPGDLTSAQMTDTDNDGLWSAFYLGSQAFRYAVTKDQEAKRYAWEAFEAFERIISINPLKGFPARTFERKGFKHSDPDRWHASQDPEWEWKGTTSSDEFVGYIFIAAVLHEMIAETESEKKRVADFIDKILTHIIENNYYLVDADGKPTLWGRWNPEYINWFPETVGDRKLGSVTIIAGLQLGYALTGKTIYKSEAFRLINEHGYLKNILIPYSNIKSTPGVIHMGVDLGNGNWNHSDDEMAFLSYWVLYHYAFTNDHKEKFSWVIQDHWKIEKPERNALWNMLSLGTSGDFDEPSTLWHLKEFPMDLVRWDIKNSHRKDIVMLPTNFRNQFTEELLPPGEVPVHRHNANAFILDGGEGGKSELAGDEYLLPYWMARYLKILE